MADLKAFAEQLVNLTVKEVNELAKILKDEYGIEIDNGRYVRVHLFGGWRRLRSWSAFIFASCSMKNRLTPGKIFNQFYDL